jgi:hypothetical protein
VGGVTSPESELTWVGDFDLDHEIKLLFAFHAAVVAMRIFEEARNEEKISIPREVCESIGSERKKAYQHNR